MKPNISVVMCVYKEPINWIKTSIDSILKQTYKNFEFIIVLDNPVYKEAKKLLQVTKKQDSRLQLIFNKKNKGVAMATHAGIQIAQSEYIAIADADDVYNLKRLEKQYNVLQNDPNIDVLFCSSMYIINENGELLKQLYIPTKKNYLNFSIKEHLKYINCITNPSCIFKKSKYQQVNGYKDIRVAHDYDLWLMFLKEDFYFQNIPEPLIYYRINQKGITHSNIYRRLKVPYLIAQNYRYNAKYQKDKYSLKYLQSFIKECDSITQDPIYQFAENIYFIYAKMPKYISFFYRIFALILISIFSKYHRKTLSCVIVRIIQPYGFSLLSKI